MRENFVPNKEKVKSLSISDLVAVQNVLQEKYIIEQVTDEKMYLLNCLGVTANELRQRTDFLFND